MGGGRGRQSPGHGVGVGVDDLVGDALVEVAQDLPERARHPGGLVERHDVVGGGHALPLQLCRHGRPPPVTKNDKQADHVVGCELVENGPLTRLTSRWAAGDHGQQ
jgi:hypothetical protein